MPFNIIESQQIISSATQTLLFEDNYLHIKNAIDQLHLIFAEPTGVKAGSITDKDIFLPSGNAVSTTKAAHCLLELERTRRFIRGINKAINKLLSERPRQVINILYAGCGPYATLLTPLTCRYNPDQIKFILLDINTESLAAVKVLYDELGLSDYVIDIVCADATAYEFPESIRVDMVISETMLNALRKEPQLAIMNNLIPQMQPETIFIPEEIRVDAVLTNWEEERKAMFTEDYEALRLVAGEIYFTKRHFRLPEPIVINIPVSDTHHDLQLFTDITVFEDEKLSAYSCSLTMPLSLGKLNNSEAIKLKFDYLMSEHPKFEYIKL